ncbi:MAG: hypothetical protein KC620_10200 [Myxococcales bacterium]|nr:hypothetical protein [Myxococcales bacterium]
MSRAPLGFGLVLVLLLLAASAAAEPLRVVIGDLAGPKVGRRDYIGFQRALKGLGGVRVQSTSGFTKQAKAMRVDDRVPQDPAALAEVCAVLEVDVVVFGTLLRPSPGQWPDAGPNDRMLVFSVYAGNDGRYIDERRVEVPRGKLTSGVWRDSAVAIEPLLSEAMRPPPPPPPPMDFAPIPVDPEPVVDYTRETVEPETPRGPFPFVRLHGGLALLSRTFDLTARKDSPLFSDGGIQYESSIVPGIALDAEVYPFGGDSEGFARGLGLGLRFEKVFLSTEASVTGPDGEAEVKTLSTSHSHLLARLIYLYDFASGIELGGHFGLGFLSFEIQENPEYNGVSYTYLDVGLSGRVPLGTPYLAVELRGSWLPYAGVGDTAKELGGEVSTSGYRVMGGLGSLMGDLSLLLGVEWTALSSEITGEGRGGRKGESATDQFLGLRLMGGYRF